MHRTVSERLSGGRTHCKEKMSRGLQLAFVVFVLNCLPLVHCCDDVVDEVDCDNRIEPGCLCVCDQEEEEPEPEECYWKLAFKAVAGSNISVISDFKSGGSINMGDSWAQDIRSNRRYRNSAILDNWHEYFIQRVRVDIYDKMVRVVRLIFDGTASRKDSWFQDERLLVSPYDDLKTGEIDAFSFEGWKPILSFHISRTYNNETCTDCAYITVVEPDVPAVEVCSHEDSLDKPFFMYGQDYTQCNNMDQAFGAGDRFLIYLKICDIM